MNTTHIDILVLGDENSTVASKLGSIKRLGDQYTISTQHRPCSSPGILEGFDLIILDACNEENAEDIERQKSATLELCRRLREETYTLILLFSFIDDEDFATDAYYNGADGFIALPIMLPLLVATLQAWLRWRVPDTISSVKSKRNV